jgi:hypothetical protein
MVHAIQNLKVQAKDHPDAQYSYQLMKDNGNIVLRALIREPKEIPEVIFFTETRELCEANWRPYLFDPLWGYDESNSIQVTAQGLVIPPSLREPKLEGSPSKP